MGRLIPSRTNRSRFDSGRVSLPSNVYLGAGGGDKVYVTMSEAVRPFQPMNELHQLSKTIPYFDFRMQKELQEYLQSLISLDSGQLETSDGTISSLMPQYVQTKRGVLFSADKDLTDELRETDLKDISVEDIVMPFPSLEFFFFDPGLPAVLFYQLDAEFYSLADQYLGEKLKFQPTPSDWGEDEDQGKRYCMDYYTREGVVVTVRGNADYLNPWLHDDDHNIGTAGGFMDAADMDKCSRFLFRLIAKLLVYSSIPEYVPVEVTDRSKLCQGEKPSKKRNRPAFPVHRISLPPTIKQYRDTGGTASHNITPHRRRGHLRKLTSDRYVNKKGQFVYVRPSMVMGGTLDDRIYEAHTRD